MTKLSILFYFLLLSISSINSQQLQWTLLSDGSSGDTPMARRDAALGYDSIYLIVYGGRDQSGMPRQDAWGFNILLGILNLIISLKLFINLFHLKVCGNHLIFQIHHLLVMVWDRRIQ
jgi:hypothetical protein